MDDNNKYNRNKDYEPDNFDDEVAFPARRNNAPERSSDIQEDYGDNFDNDVKFVGDYDEDAVQMPEIDFEDDMETPVKMPSERDDRTQTPDYGDNFDSQTGEQVSKATKDFQYDLSSDDIGTHLAGGLAAGLAQRDRDLSPDYYRHRRTRHAGSLQHLAAAARLAGDRPFCGPVERRIA